jgi:hypothetical protein
MFIRIFPNDWRPDRKEFLLWQKETFTAAKRRLTCFWVRWVKRATNGFEE